MTAGTILVKASPFEAAASFYTETVLWDSVFMSGRTELEIDVEVIVAGAVGSLLTFPALAQEVRSIGPHWSAGSTAD